MSNQIGERTSLVQQPADRSRKKSSLSAKLCIASACITFVAYTAVAYIQNMNSDATLLNLDRFDFRLLSSKPHQHHKKYQCKDDGMYSTHTAKTAYEMPFAALFKDTKGEKKFEASSVFSVDGTYYAICDNSWSISKFSADLTPFSEENIMIGDPNREEEDSGYEVIFHHDGVFYVIRESVEHGPETNTSYHAIIEELVVTGGDYEIKDQCSCEFEFEGTSKGFEGGFGMEGIDGVFYVIGLCEGNHCSEKHKSDKGNGQMVLMKKVGCLWETVKVIDVPKTAYFTDYSDISVRRNGKVAITTQEDSAVWIGQLLGVVDGKLDPDIVAFDKDEHEVFQFPMSPGCKTLYCNIEGVSFINDNMIIAVSDKMKKGGKQPYYCLEKDQSIHAFVLP